MNDEYVPVLYDRSLHVQCGSCGWEMARTSLEYDPGMFVVTCANDKCINNGTQFRIKMREIPYEVI